MKIGVLTYHAVPNFGAQLQATSTIGFIKRKGHEAVILNWYPQDLENMYSKRIPREQVLMHNEYTKSCLPITDICRTEEDLINQINEHEIDAIIVGSDALFKYTPFKKRKRFSKRRLRFIKKELLSVESIEGNPFWGVFKNRLKKTIPVVAFSVSSQNCPFHEMTSTEKQIMSNALKCFSLITVRDEWTKLMVENLLDKKVIITPDPVFSFNQNCYNSLPSEEDIRKKYKLDRKYVVLSFSKKYINAQYIKCLADVISDRGIEPVGLPMPEGLFAGDIIKQIPLPLDTLEWYALIKYSSGYIGERMHPIVVCLHNIVPFFSFDEYGTYRNSLFGMKKRFVIESSKTYQILKKAGLLNYYYSYNIGKEKPQPSFVIDRLESFDYSSCARFSNDYQQLYEAEMDRVFSVLKENK